MIAGPSFAPSRLIKIKENGGIYTLCLDSDKKPRPYVALSYCWGGPQRHQTTKKNLAEHFLDISYNSLPKTLKEAVKVTNGLGYHYLWVDSMCIVQDDDYDRFGEIAQMPLIYSSSIVTIAASCAATADDGFLHDRLEDQIIFDLPVIVPDGIHTTVYGISLDGYKDGYGEHPLNKRAWTLQERILSPRLLEFGYTQTTWRCDTVVQGTSDGWTPSPQREFIDSIAPNFTEGNIRSNWWKLVAEYTDRKLSIASDRALAIAGIAGRFGDTTKDDYIAGLWKSTVLEDLHWEVSPQDPFLYPDEQQTLGELSWEAEVLDLWGHLGRGPQSQKASR